MTLIWLCRYLCFMFCLLTMAAMSPTETPETPEDESFRQVAVGVVLVLAVLSCIVAVVLGRLYKKNPELPVFQSKLALVAAMALSVLGTMLLAG